MTHRYPRLAFLFVVAVLLAGCASRPPAPVIDRSPEMTTRPPPPPVATPVPPPEVPAQLYTVKRGDTLYQIALDHGLDYRDLAAWNNISNVNVLQVGQVLRLNAPGATTTASGVTTAPLRTGPPVSGDGQEGKPPTSLSGASGRGNTPIYKSEPKAVKVPYSEQTFAQMQQMQQVQAVPPPQAPQDAGAAPAGPAPPPTGAAAPAPTRAESARVPEIDDEEKIAWIWPTVGKVVAGFSETANLKGIDIAGKSGQSVVASAAGKVVYAGTGLRGYGKLIIIKHSSTYLSAYAHNKEILVKEGQQVAKGQQIAEMGNTEADQVMLHFEIRRLGKPIDPIKFLPPA